MLRHESLLDSLSLIQLQHNQTVQQKSVIKTKNENKKQTEIKKKKEKKKRITRGSHMKVAN